MADSATIIDAMRASHLRNDPLFSAARSVHESDLPDTSKAKLVKHISDARAAHPAAPKKDSFDIGRSRIPGSFAAVYDRVMKKGGK